MKNHRNKYAAEKIIKMLIDPDESKICREKPSSVTKSATYVVDVRNLQNAEDIKKDEFGIWKYSGSHPLVFKVYTEEAGHIHWCLRFTLKKTVAKVLKGAVKVSLGAM